MNNHFLAEVFAITKKKGGGKAPVISELAVTENGTYEAPTGVDGYSPVIVNVPTGGGGAAVLQSGANLIDYDGSLVQHYTKEEFLALTEMPSNPSHDGLVAQGWNWSLADAKAYIEEYGSLNIGQMYTTDTGDTRIYIHIDEDTPQNRLTFYIRFTSSVANNVTIDWGDGTVETKGSTTATNYPHTYATGGDYVIKLKVNSGTISFYGDGTSATNGSSIYGSRANAYSYNRGRITKVEIGNGVNNIGARAFFNCYSLASITISSDVTSIGSYSFSACYTIASIIIPNGITSIGSYAFNDCYNLISIAIPNGMTTIFSCAFQNCYCLTSITIPNGVTNIGDHVFNYCSSLVLIIIPNGVTSIEANAFQNCRTLKYITIPNGVISIGDNAFSYCYSLTRIIIPNSVRSIGNNIFQYCNSITSISIPVGVTSIGVQAFGGCYALTSFTIPDGVTNIGNNALVNCYSLTYIIIPNSVTSIGTSAFASCHGISEYHLLPTTPPALANNNAFLDIASDCKIYVPYSADHSILAAYQSATNWSKYATHMLEDSQP